MSGTKRSGYVAIVGRPNVGKSSLLNRVIGTKISIVSDKAQTTRTQVVGVRMVGDAQLVLFDTPGLHRGQRKRINALMNQTARRTLSDADVIVWVVEPEFADDDAVILDAVTGRTVVLAINKIDRLKRKDELLPVIASWQGRGAFRDIVPLSARDGDNVDRLLAVVAEALPEGEWHYDPATVALQEDAQYFAELVREAVLQHTHQEVPHGVAVQVEILKRDEGHVAATIYVEKESHKRIVVGGGGAMVRAIGTRARREMQRHWGRGIHLDLWVKVREDWANDDRALRMLGLLD